MIEKVLDTNDFAPAIRHGLRSLQEEVKHGHTVSPLHEQAPDIDLWKHDLQPFVGRTWLELPWYFSEAYFYRRILEATRYFQKGESQGRDPYRPQKLHELLGNGEQALERFEVSLAQLPSKPDERLSDLLLFALWGNRADLSFEAMSQTAYRSLERSSTNGLLVDHRPLIWQHLRAGLYRIDFVSDNSGLELLFDLALADFLLTEDLVRRITFHVKGQPFFVSDTMVPDVFDALACLERRPGLRGLVQRLRGYLSSGQLGLQPDLFWVLGRGFHLLPPLLREKLAQANLVIFKGDANYRRLLDDRQWPVSTPMEDVTRYLPFPFATIRTIKAPLAIDLNEELADQLSARDPEWMFHGQYGVIRFVTQGASR